MHDHFNNNSVLRLRIITPYTNTTENLKKSEVLVVEICLNTDGNPVQFHTEFIMTCYALLSH